MMTTKDQDKDQDNLQQAVSISAGKEYYRFAHYLIGSTTFAFLLIWSFFPITEREVTTTTVTTKYPPFINDIQLLKLLPQRRWVIIGESICLMAMLCAYIGLLLYDEDVLAVELDDYRTMVDDRSVIVDDRIKSLSSSSTSYFNSNVDRYSDRYSYNINNTVDELLLFNATSGVLDIPLMDVCEVLFAAGENEKKRGERGEERKRGGGDVM